MKRKFPVPEKLNKQEQPRKGEIFTNQGQRPWE